MQLHAAELIPGATARLGILRFRNLLQTEQRSIERLCRSFDCGRHSNVHVL